MKTKIIIGMLVLLIFLVGCGNEQTPFAEPQIHTCNLYFNGSLKEKGITTLDSCQDYLDNKIEFNMNNDAYIEEKRCLDEKGKQYCDSINESYLEIINNNIYFKCKIFSRKEGYEAGDFYFTDEEQRDCRHAYDLERNRHIMNIIPLWSVNETTN